MGDFHQGGVITTLHRLGRPKVERMEEELLSTSRSRPIALVLPCLVSELQGPGLKGIIDALRSIHYLRQIVVSISGTDERFEYEQMRQAFDGVRTLTGEQPTILWNSGGRVQRLFGTVTPPGIEGVRLRDSSDWTHPDPHGRFRFEPIRSGPASVEIDTGPEVFVTEWTLL